MTGPTVIFYLLAALTIVSGILSVTTRQIFRAAIYLLFSLIGVAGIYLWLNYQFIFAVQVVVYVGGIVVLIIFSIFLTQQAGEKMARQTTGRKIFSFLAVFLGFALAMIQVYEHQFFETAKEPVSANIKDIGTRMLGTGDEGYALPFEVISILLLAAMIGCIVIAMREKGVESRESEDVRRET